MAEEQRNALREKTPSGDGKPVRVGSSSATSLWIVLTAGAAMVLVAVLSSVFGWKTSLIAVLLILGLMLSCFYGRDWMAHRFTSGLMQLPFTSRETARANTIAARRARLPATADEHGGAALPDTGIAVPLSENWGMLVSALAGSIRMTLPDRCLVAADDTTLRFAWQEHSGKSELVNLLVAPPGDEVDRAVRASVQALADVQQFVNRVADQPWPGGHAKPSPSAAATDGTVKALRKSLPAMRQVQR